MKKYEKPEVEIEEFFENEVLTESGGDIFLPPDEF